MTVTVDLARCVRCAACAITAPEMFDVSRKGTRVVRSPETAAERSAVIAASLMCPTQAIEMTEMGSASS